MDRCWVKDIIDNDFILVTLMVDDKTKLATPLEVEKMASSIKLKTIGDKWATFQHLVVNNAPALLRNAHCC